MKTIAELYLANPERWIRYEQMRGDGHCCLRGAAAEVYGTTNSLYGGEFQQALTSISSRSVVDYITTAWQPTFGKSSTFAWPWDYDIIFRP